MTTLNVKSKELEGQTVRKKIQVTLIKAEEKKKNTGSAKCTCNLQKQKTKTTLNI